MHYKYSVSEYKYHRDLTTNPKSICAGDTIHYFSGAPFRLILKTKQQSSHVWDLIVLAPRGIIETTMDVRNLWIV
jgi:hypothetical protein